MATDPAIIPWNAVWFGMMMVLCGTILAWHGVGQRRPSRVAGLGGLIVLFGVTLMLGTTLVNGTVMLARAFEVAVQQAVAAAQPQNQKGAPR